MCLCLKLCKQVLLKVCLKAVKIWGRPPDWHYLKCSRSGINKSPGRGWVKQNKTKQKQNISFFINKNKTKHIFQSVGRHPPPSRAFWLCNKLIDREGLLVAGHSVIRQNKQVAFGQLDFFACLSSSTLPVSRRISGSRLEARRPGNANRQHHKLQRWVKAASVRSFPANRSEPLVHLPWFTAYYDYYTVLSLELEFRNYCLRITHVAQKTQDV